MTAMVTRLVVSKLSNTFPMLPNPSPLKMLVMELSGMDRKGTVNVNPS